MTTYSVRTDITYDENKMPHTVYGIDAYQNGILVRKIPDVFFELAKAEHFVGLCNSLGLSLIHLSDVIDDVIS